MRHQLIKIIDNKQEMKGTAMNKTILFASLLTIMTLPNVAYANCSGNACSDLRINQSGNCVTLSNSNSNRTIKVHGNNWIPAYVFRVPSNSEITPRGIDNVCYKNWYSTWIAEYD